MKEVTRAYEEGNLARLLEIEQLWLSGGKVRSGQSDDATRCSELERIVSELKAQMQALEGALRDLRKASPLAQMFGLRRASAAAQLEQLEALVVAATEELEPIRRLRDFVQAFSGRKISLAEFLRGPQLLDQTERDLIEAALEFVLEGLDADFDLNEPRRRRPHGKRRSRRQQGFDDVPF
jgi:exonuclease VII small subunit